MANRRKDVREECAEGKKEKEVDADIAKFKIPKLSANSKLGLVGWSVVYLPTDQPTLSPSRALIE